MMAERLQFFMIKDITCSTEASSKKAVYLKVHRDSKNRIKSLQELDKKQMQELLEDTGLIFE